MSDITEVYEYSVAQKAEGVWKWRRAGLIAAYILLPVLALILIIKSTIFAPFGALLALGDAVLVFFTWRFVNLEYEYSVLSGCVTFSHIQNVFNHRIKKKKTSFYIKDCVRIAPLGQHLYADEYNGWNAEKTYSALSSSKAEDAYFAIYTDSDGAKCAFLFEATEEMLKRCRFYNKDATVTVKTRF
jgi:hypothetical protein